MWFYFFKLSTSNFVHHRYASYSYIVFCLLFFSYFIIYVRFNLTSKFDTVYHIQRKTLKLVDKPNNTSKLPMKYILLWTSPKKFPFVYFGEGNSVFVKKSCKWTNCYVTSDRNYLGSYAEFEVVAFNGPQLPMMMYHHDWPKQRHERQKYVFANIESAANYAVRTDVFNGFFNWTWTYKLNSDAVWGYYVIKDAEDRVVGPKENINWILPWNMDPIDKDYLSKLQLKTKAAAWLCSSKTSNSRREGFVEKLQKYLRKSHYKVDIFGDCGDHSCPKELMTRCLQTIQKHYFFYLAFENSFSDDYVTEKVLHALNYDTVPVVYGGANYSRFLPPGSYLDAAKMGPRALAKLMIQLINDPLEYSRFFMWKNHYSFHAPHLTPHTDTYCKFCEMINNDTLMKEHKSYDLFNVWWMDKAQKIL